MSLSRNILITFPAKLDYHDLLKSFPSFLFLFGLHFQNFNFLCSSMTTAEYRTNPERIKLIQCRMEPRNDEMHLVALGTSILVIVRRMADTIFQSESDLWLDYDLESWSLILLIVSAVWQKTINNAQVPSATWALETLVHSIGKQSCRRLHEENGTAGGVQYSLFTVFTFFVSIFSLTYD